MNRIRFIALIIIIGITIAIAFSSLFSALDTGNTDAIAHTEGLHSIEARHIIGNEMKNIFWIVQVSDIHISKFNDLKRGPDLEKLCAQYLSIIKPEVVLVTGDLTDSKTANGIESMQIRDEWIMYENTIKRCSTYSRAKWLDLRGNHDSFDVFDFKSNNNYYRMHSFSGVDFRQATDFPSAYVYTLALPFGAYSFIGIDACSRPGPNRPFNFFGYLDDKQIQNLKTLEVLYEGSNHSVWYGHFPTSLIVHDPPVLRQIMSSSIAYLCGHLHTLGNFVPKMYSRHKTGQLELELGDWKDSRIFRVMVFDHDLMSFTDVKLGVWPIVIITNPKNNQFYSSNEPIHMIESSTHIRMLIFNHHKIERVEITIDKHIEGYAHQVDPNQPLYVLPWSPAHYAYNTHVIEVLIEDDRGVRTKVKQHFSVDGTELGFKLLPRLILMLNIYSVGKVIFGLLVLIYILLLTSLRQFTYIRIYLLRGRTFIIVFFNSWIMKLWLVSRTDVLYCILIGYSLYLTFGPWFLGYLLSDRIGVVFVWGIIIQDTFIPGGITYFYGIFQFVTFTVPLTLILGHLLDIRRKYGHNMLFYHHLSVFLPAAILVIFTIYLVATEFPRAYGQTSLLLGPLRTGSVLLLPLSVWFAYRTDLKQVLAV